MTSALDLTVKVLKRAQSLQTAVSTRVYPIVAPERADIWPCLVVDLVGEGEHAVLDGPSRWYDSTISVACLAEKPFDADELGELVKRALEDWNGPVTSDGSPAIIHGSATYRKSGADVFDYSDDRSIARRLIDFDVSWRPNA